MPPRTRELARLANDLERNARRLRRSLEQIGTIEATVALYEKHLDALRKKYGGSEP
jgi:hypothetical protein